jgi:alpha-tubulin suppressor-like RCC1 family protein
MRTWRALCLAGLLAAAVLIVLVIFGGRSHPVHANPLGGITAVSAGERYTCALTSEGGVKCWGYGFHGALGDGTYDASSTPVDVVGLTTGVAAISAGHDYLCALTVAGGVKCGRSAPSDVQGLTAGVTQITAGHQHACAALASGGLKCWGANDYGQMGDGTTAPHASPVDVVGLSGPVVSLDAGFEHTCAVTTAGVVFCWGWNNYGQLGDGTTTSRLSATPIAGLDSAVAVATGLNQSCAVMESGAVKCWGFGYGQTPVEVPGLSAVVAVDSALTHTCALTQSGGVKCWGSNGFGQLGDGMQCGSQCASPVDVTGLSSGVASISVGYNHTCAVLDGGGAKCWGVNYDGQLGNGDHAETNPIPVDVVAQDVKPTPTPTPCPSGVCPTPTPHPSVPQTGLDFSIAIDSNGDGVPDCSTQTDQPHECSLDPGSTFHVVMNLHALPVGVPAYAAFQVYLASVGVASQGTWSSLWPDCGFPAQAFGSGFVSVACAMGVGGARSSSYGGPLAAVDFTCNGNGSVTMVHGRGLNSHIVTGVGSAYAEAEAGGETLAVNCGPLLRGDTNCDTVINAVDAHLELEYDARLITWLDCPQQADVNLDSKTNPVDAVLTDQYDAKLIDRLPPNQLRP